jgi:hypothetical protein
MIYVMENNNTVGNPAPPAWNAVLPYLTGEINSLQTFE